MIQYSINSIYNIVCIIYRLSPPASATCTIGSTSPAAATATGGKYDRRAECAQPPSAKCEHKVPQPPSVSAGTRCRWAPSRRTAKNPGVPPEECNVYIGPWCAWPNDHSCSQTPQNLRRFWLSFRPGMMIFFSTKSCPICNNMLPVSPSK